MHKIFKYELRVTDDQVVSMPEGSKILRVEVQAGKPYIWALVNPEVTPIDRKIVTRGTGHEIDSDYLESLTYLGTYYLSGNALVFHVFEEAAF